MWSKRKRRVLWLRFLKRLGYFNGVVFNKQELSNEQRMGIRIFERAVTINDADIFMSPLSDSIYIEIKDIYLILDGNDLQIINGKYQYDLHYNEQVRSRMTDKVLKVIESKKADVEKRIRAKSDRTLHSIFDEIMILKSTEIKE
jgi:hypothetical protein